MRTCAVDEGDDSALPITLGHLAALECWAGKYDLAIALATEGRDHAERMGIRAPMPASVHVLALAHRGHPGEARALGERDLAADESAGFMSAVALDLRSLGTAELMAATFQRPPATFSAHWRSHPRRSVSTSRPSSGCTRMRSRP
jgi:hypothetical protein